MLLRTIGHLLALDVGWFIYDLLWVFLGFIFMQLAVYVKLLPEGAKPSIKGYIFLVIFLYAILDTVTLAGIEMYSHNYILTFVVFQMCVMVLTERTSLAKYNLIIFAGFFLFASWAVTPF